MQSWIEQGRIPFVAGLVSLHVVVSIIVIVLFKIRARNRPLFRRLRAKLAQGAGR